MELICPACEARYQLPPGAVPDEGRQVSCQNCGHSWLGLPEWNGYDGEIIDPDQVWSERVLFLETDRARQLRGVTKGTWKLIEDREREVKELYELRSDPAEARDLAERSSRKAEDLGGLLDAFFGPGGSAGE